MAATAEKREERAGVSSKAAAPLIGRARPLAAFCADSCSGLKVHACNDIRTCLRASQGGALALETAQIIIFKHCPRNRGSLWEAPHIHIRTGESSAFRGLSAAVL